MTNYEWINKANGDTPAYPIVRPDHERGMTKRERMAMEFTAAIIAGSVARGVPGSEWLDAPMMGAKLADNLLEIL